MRHKLVNFTRGSQLIGHFSFMFAAGLKAPLVISALVFAGAIVWRAASSLDDHEAYLCWMRLYALIYGWFEFDPDRSANLELASGRLLPMPISALPGHPLVLDAWAKLADAVRSGSMLAAVATAPSVVAFAWIAAWFGRRSKESRHERGASLATLQALVADVEDHNRRERAREYGAMLGARWRFLTHAERRSAGLFEPYCLAGVPYPWRLEQSHSMVIGTTGTGKTVAMRDLLAQARARSARAVVFDLTGAYIEAFFDPARDVILNPLDARCPQWSVFEDCADEATLTAAAEALVPHDGGGSEQFWVLAARMLFVEMCLKLMAEGRATNAALSAELMTASLSHVHRLMQGTVADPLTAPEAARMAESIRAVFNANAKALKMLPTSGPLFSVRRWIGDDRADGSFLFVSARYIDMPVASRLLTVWMDTAMNSLMADPRSRELKLWFLFDELGALHRLPAIEKGLQTVRNYGGAIVAGVHAYAKLKETYGENIAMTLASLARTKLVLATADRDSASWCSDFIGHRQYREMEEGYSYGYNNARDAVSLTPRRQIEPLLLPDQLMNLPRLQGYLKFPDGFPAAPVRLDIRDYPRIADAFVPRMTSNGSPPADARRGQPLLTGNGQAADTASDQGPGPRSGSNLARATPSVPIQGFFDFAAGASTNVDRPDHSLNLPVSLPIQPAAADRQSSSNGAGLIANAPSAPVSTRPVSSVSGHGALAPTIAPPALAPSRTQGFLRFTPEAGPDPRHELRLGGGDERPPPRDEIDIER